MRLPPLQAGILLRRYQRFLADIQLPDGSIITAHTPNTGSMKQCAVAGYRVMLSHSDNPKRKYPHTLELIEVNGAWVDINTQRSNRVVAEALAGGVVDDLAGYTIHPERKLGESRMDFMLQRGEKRLWLEVKNVTLMGSSVCACFPDAPTARGRRHLQELLAAQRRGDGAAMVFLVQRAEAQLFSPAGDIDSAYAELLRQVLSAGVQAYALRTVTDSSFTRVDRRIPVVV